MLTVLGGLAEFERHLILSRTNEGRVRAKARGVRFGRKPKLTSISGMRNWPGSRKGKR
jgi:DNA invertase Pin-like site-specific DNA recombinase